MQLSSRLVAHSARALMMLVIAVPALAAVDTAPANPPPVGEVPSANESFNLGVVFGNQLRHGGMDQVLSFDDLMRGVKVGLGGKDLSNEEKARVTQWLRSGREVVASRNRAAAAEFLVKNAQADGVKTTASGLQYRVESLGDPKATSPGKNDEVTVQYRGMLLDGTEFDSSYTRGQSVSFKLNGVIQGWQEALQLMKPGAKWKLFVPPQLAYDTASPPAIPPGSLLIFDVELLKVGPAKLSQLPPKDKQVVKPATAPSGTP